MTWSIDKNASPATCARLVTSQVIGIVWDFYEAVDVIQWQGLSLWMYRTAVGRIQTKICLAKHLFFLRLGTNIIDEVRAPSNKHFERE